MWVEGLLTVGDTVAVAVENLLSRSAVQRANALETLETVGESEIVRPLIAVWESGESSGAALPEGWLTDLLDHPDAWLRACAVLAVAMESGASLNEKLRIMSRFDADDIVRATAEKALLGEDEMDTLATLSLMEQILFLRRVPLFADLTPADLKQVAGITTEVLFADGQVSARQGEMGTEMYIIVSGEVRVLMTNEAHSQAHEVARRCCGDYVGEMTIISQEPRIATLIADGEVRVLCIHQKQFQGILRERPDTSLALIRTLGQRLKEASENR